MITYKELNIKARDIEQKTGLQHLDVYRRFMFERILERISVSKYNENFILKGGLLLSAMLGINSRSTRDMDISIKGIDVSQEKMLGILNEILAIDIGDKVTPKELNFEYISIFENKKIYIDTYNIETILAEKIETILRRGKYNTRMKDYYDIYFFLTKLKNDIDLKIFTQALNNTLRKREAFKYYNDYKQILDLLSKDNRIANYWDNYAKKNKYAENIEFEEIVKILKEFLNSIN